MKLSGSSDPSICPWFFNNNRFSADIDKLSSSDLTMVKGLMKLLCSVIKRNDVVPLCLAAAFLTYPQREACCRTVIPGAEPWVTTESSLHLNELNFAAL